MKSKLLKGGIITAVSAVALHVAYKLLRKEGAKGPIYEKKES